MISVLHFVFLFLSLLYYHGLLASTATSPVKASTKIGVVHGLQQDVPNDKGIIKTVYKFLGIPYAQKPINQLRFKRPESINNPTLNNYNATFYRPVCAQIEHYFDSVKLAWRGFDGGNETYVSEDCLYLNIYTPSTNCPSKKYPVIAYIHGGSYVAGTPVRDVSPGEFLPRYDVVLVTIQYRLGAFGFFTTGDSEAPGNLGLLDQVKALEWIRDNIDEFCGDKNSVTLLGESAGGSSVSLHYLSPLSKGLFHRGIAVSGVASTFFALKPKSTVLKACNTLLKGLGCGTQQTSQLKLHCLRLKSTNDIIQNNTDFINLQPFVDGYFLLDEPRKLLKKGRFPKLPLMSGFVSNEGTNAISQPNIDTSEQYKNYLDKEFLQKQFGYTKEQAPNAFDALEFQYYPWDDSVQKTRSEAFRDNFIDILTDYKVIAPTIEALSYHRQHGAKTYLFKFAHRSLNKRGQAWKGVEHEDTTPYKFGLPFLTFARTNLTFDNEDKVVSSLMVNTFTNFAKTGIPSPGSAFSFRWTASDTADRAYLKFQRTSAVIRRKYEPLRMAFWNDYFPTLFPCKERKAWYGQCKRSEAPRSLESSKGESNLVRGASNPEIELW